MAKRRRRRNTTQLLAVRTLVDIKAKRLAFLRDVSDILTDALGFTVKVSLVKPNRLAGMSLDMRRAARMTKKQARAQIVSSAFAPFPQEEPE
jgi:hypothetical protein